MSKKSSRIKIFLLAKSPILLGVLACLAGIWFMLYRPPAIIHVDGEFESEVKKVVEKMDAKKKIINILSDRLDDYCTQLEKETFFGFSLKRFNQEQLKKLESIKADIGKLSSIIDSMEKSVAGSLAVETWRLFFLIILILGSISLLFYLFTLYARAVKIFGDRETQRDNLDREEKFQCENNFRKYATIGAEELETVKMAFKQIEDNNAQFENIKKKLENKIAEISSRASCLKNKRKAKTEDFNKEFDQLEASVKAADEILSQDFKEYTAAIGSAKTIGSDKLEAVNVITAEKLREAVRNVTGT